MTCDFSSIMVRRAVVRTIGIAMLLSATATSGGAQDSFGKRAPARGPDTTRARDVPPSSRNAPVSSPNATQAGRALNAPTDKLSMMEREDFGVAPVRTLHSGAMHGPTPASIPGAQVITTAGLLDLQRRQIPHVIVDVLGAPDMLPNAIPGAWLSQPGTFSDEVQMRAKQMLMQATQGRQDTPLVFYCMSPQCWMSYNAALRAVNAGFTNVLWYRGGVEAWRRGGQR